MKSILIILGVISSIISFNSRAVEEHHNIKVINCRAIPNGNVQILGISNTDNIQRNLIYSSDMFSDKVLDRYLSLCMTSITTGIKLRADYLECSNNSCNPKVSSTVQIFTN